MASIVTLAPGKYARWNHGILQILQIFQDRTAYWIDGKDATVKGRVEAFPEMPRAEMPHTEKAGKAIWFRTQDGNGSFVIFNENWGSPDPIA